MENNLVKIDKKDKKIMKCLDEDSRQPYSTIAKIAGLSTEGVKYRISRILSNRIINRLFSEPNLNKLGLKTFRLYIKTSSMSKEMQDELFNKYCKKPNTQWVAACQGDWDYIIRFSLPSEVEFKEEVGKLMNEYGEFVKKKNISLGLYNSFFPLTFIVGGERTSRISLEKPEPKCKLDQNDYMILSTLYENSRTQSTDIAKKIGLTPEAVQYRIRKLYKENVIRYNIAHYNPQALGLSKYKIFFSIQNTGKEKELVRYFEQHPNVEFLIRAVGEWDMEVDVYVKNSSELHDVINEMTAKHGDLIREHSATAILKENLGNPLRQFLEK